VRVSFAACIVLLVMAAPEASAAAPTPLAFAVSFMVDALEVPAIGAGRVANIITMHKRIDPDRSTFCMRHEGPTEPTLPA
jgi:hypothetical protein